MHVKLTVHPGSPKSILERVHRGMVFSAKDYGTNAFDIALYGIVAGWSREWEEYKEEFEPFGITVEDFNALKEMYQQFIQIQNKFYR